jgi:hypothetical protein
MFSGVYITRSFLIVGKGAVKLELCVLFYAVFLDVFIVAFSLLYPRPLHAALLTNSGRSFVCIYYFSKIKSLVVAAFVSIRVVE